MSKTSIEEILAPKPEARPDARSVSRTALRTMALRDLTYKADATQ